MAGKIKPAMLTAKQIKWLRCNNMPFRRALADVRRADTNARRCQRMANQPQRLWTGKPLPFLPMPYGSLTPVDSLQIDGEPDVGQM